jgi:putative oxidoreductase
MTKERSTTSFSDVGLLMIRLILAAVFMFHGSQKLFGLFDGPGLKATAAAFGKMGFQMPMVSALAAGSAEFFGGLVVLIGVGARIAAIPMAFTMFVACFTVHAKAFSSQHGGMEFPLTLAVTLVALVLIGPGRLTVARFVDAPQRGDLHASNL